MTYQYIFLSKFFWGYYWDMTSFCSHKRCRNYSNFVRFLRLPKKILFKNMILVFLLFHKYKPNYNSRINNWLKRCNYCNGTQTHNQLVCKQTLKMVGLSVCLWTKWLWVPVTLQSLKLQILCLFWAGSSLTFRQL